MKNIESIMSCTFFSLLGNAFINFLGGWDINLKALLVIMGIDLLTGFLLAAVFKKSSKSKSGKVSSNAMFIGLIKKFTVVILVGIATILEDVTAMQNIRNITILFFIGNEGISILENCGQMGIKYPSTLENILDVLTKEKDYDVS